MKILIIRHGDPDYSIDSLTPVGWEEAEILSGYVSQMNIKDFYVSPLGRAKDTAAATLKKLNREAVECQWLQEFPSRIRRPDAEGPTISWDWLPEDWTEVSEYYDSRKWCTTDVMKAGGVDREYERVVTEFDKLLAAYGYERENNYYRVTKANNDTIAFFCHFGLECVLLSHLLNVSPMVLWHGTCAAPTSVTTLVTEERRKGIAAFRMLSFGDTAHLYTAGRKPSFAGRFCENFENTWERHD